MDPHLSSLGEIGALEPLDGGWSGETFLASAAGERVVLRLYVRPSVRGDAAAEVDASLLRLVRGLVPVPEVLEVRRGDSGADRPALLVTSLVHGVRADEVLPTLAPTALASLGHSLGTLAAVLAGMPMPRPGVFVDGDLTIAPFPVGSDVPGLVDALEPRLEHLSPGELSALHALAEEAQALLDGVGRTCLVHSDLNPKNVLLAHDPDGGAGTDVAALVDWEHAHAGHPFTDLGNLLRFDRDPPWVEGVLAAWQDRHGGDPATTAVLARAADLPALVDLATRRADNPVAARADALLRRIIATRDIGAAPPR